MNDAPRMIAQELTERLASLERALVHAQAAVRHAQAFIDEILAEIATTPQEMDRCPPR